MSNTDHKPVPPDSLTDEHPDSSDPAYLEWKRKKIEEALRQAREHPEDTLSEREIWKKFGLEG